MTIADGQEATAEDVLAAIAGSHTVASSGKFYQDKGASVVRYGDRLLVGAAADTQADADRGQTTDWLSGMMAATSIGAYPLWGATTASIARYGTIGLLAASRTSDAAANKAMLGYTPSSIGVASWAIDDDASSPRSTTAYAYYGEVWRMAGASYQPSFAMELECVNFGTSQGDSTPYHVNCGGGTYAIQLGSGGESRSSTTLPRSTPAFSSGLPRLPERTETTTATRPRWCWRRVRASSGARRRPPADRATIRACSRAA